jgi:hypothetical protein
MDVRSATKGKPRSRYSVRFMVHISLTLSRNAHAVEVCSCFERAVRTGIGSTAAAIGRDAITHGARKHHRTPEPLSQGGGKRSQEANRYAAPGVKGKSLGERASRFLFPDSR